MTIIINGTNAPTAGAVAVGDGTTLAFTAAGTAGYVLTSNGSGVPTWTDNGSGTVTNIAATVPSVFNIAGSPITTSGTLAITYSGTALPNTSGGTGQTGAFTQYGVTYASSTTALATTAAGTAGYILTSNGSSAPTFQAPAASGISTGKSIAMAMIFGF